MQDNNILNIEDISVDTAVRSENEGTPENETEKESVYRVFKTQEEFQHCIDRALGKRLLKQRETQEKADELSDSLKKVFDKFKVSSISELMLLSENTPKNSEEQSSSAEALKDELQNLSQNEGGFFATEQAQQMLEDKRVGALVKSGFTLKDAFDAVRVNEILQENSKKEREKVIREIRTRGLRPQEDAVNAFGSFSATLDPKNLSPAQRADIKERVRRGERITF